MLSLAQYFSTLAPDIYNAKDENDQYAKRAQVEAFYPIAQEQVTATVWGKFTNKAVVLLSLHLYALNVADDSTAMKGPLVSASTGEFSSKSWASPTGGQAMTEDYQATKWGQQYVSLRRSAYGENIMPAAGR